ncbi:hypothetical protein HYDPIDRAFT_169288 [Hydnomerulius pinastri MD-312]|uniref:DUF2855 family protein n=1 Tax=Hydnomerulius pinastri MD-312 TaxID=994086 RepID=A0A0C9WCH4_9AGAM|nr:hypothetical protein HYDPIDRAFT_169288 [Hydnomerulius pinastri MD-312]
MEVLANVTLCHPRPSSGQDTSQAILVNSQVPRNLSANCVVVRVDRFGYSANNVTYQALGEIPHFRYFDFHAAPESEGVSPKTHGVSPVWGFGTIIASTHAAIRVGERVYGYFAATRYLVLPISPTDISKYAFFVSRPHLPADRRPYNQVTRCSSDALYDPSPEVEDLTMLYRPLFWTSFWCEDWINSSQYRGGATRVLISSASAKTAFCLAYLIRKRNATPGNTNSTMQVVGLTSKKNLDFTKRLRLYDHVLVYEDFDTTSIMNAPSQKWLYIDVAGNEALNGKIINHFTSNAKLNLVGSIALGLTNLSPSSGSPSASNWSTNDFSSHRAPSTLEQFFMPEWLAVRKKQLSVTEITQLQKDAWFALMRDCRTWNVTLCRVYGANSVKSAYDEVVRSGIPPDQGFIWSMWEDERENERARL